MGGRSPALACLFLLGGLLFAQDAGQGRAFLLRGPDVVKGLPFFPPNVLRALAGAYSLDAPSALEPARDASRAGELKLWYTREALVLGSAWKRAEAYGGGAYLMGRGGGSVLLLRAEGYYLFFELPGAAPSAPEELKRRAFVRAFDRKFLSFFKNAGSDAELSFPAFVDY